MTIGPCSVTRSHAARGKKRDNLAYVNYMVDDLLTLPEIGSGPGWQMDWR
jgi:hypothetical protein